jgi:hypothetical protein
MHPIGLLVVRFHLLHKKVNRKTMTSYMEIIPQMMAG